MKYIIFLIPVLLFINRPKFHDFGTYYSHKKYDHVKLTLNPDSSYYQSWTSCTFSFRQSGKWIMMADTFTLCPISVKQDRGDAGDISRINKILVIGDSLYILYRKNNGEYHRFIKLTPHK